MSKKTIVFIHPDLGIGGAERLVIDAAVGLQSRGHKITILTSHCDPAHCFEEARDGEFLRSQSIAKISWLSVRRLNNASRHSRCPSTRQQDLPSLNRWPTGNTIRYPASSLPRLLCGHLLFGTKDTGSRCFLRGPIECLCAVTQMALSEGESVVLWAFPGSTSRAI